MEPNFSNYTIDELNEALAGINAERYPQRVLEIEAQLARRQAAIAEQGFVAAGEARGHGEQRWSATVHRVSASTLLSLLLIGSTISFGILGVLAGIAALFGASTVEFNDANLTGIKGLIAGPVITVLLAIFLSLFMFVAIYIGLRIYACFRPFQIEVIQPSNNEPSKTI